MAGRGHRAASRPRATQTLRGEQRVVGQRQGSTGHRAQIPLLGNVAQAVGARRCPANPSPVLAEQPQGSARPGSNHGPRTDRRSRGGGRGPAPCPRDPRDPQDLTLRTVRSKGRPRFRRACKRAAGRHFGATTRRCALRWALPRAAVPRPAFRCDEALRASSGPEGSDEPGQPARRASTGHKRSHKRAGTSSSL